MDQPTRFARSHRLGSIVELSNQLAGDFDVASPVSATHAQLTLRCVGSNPLPLPESYAPCNLRLALLSASLPSVPGLRCRALSAGQGTPPSPAALRDAWLCQCCCTAANARQFAAHRKWPEPLARSFIRQEASARGVRQGEGVGRCRQPPANVSQGSTLNPPTACRWIATPEGRAIRRRAGEIFPGKQESEHALTCMRYSGSSEPPAGVVSKLTLQPCGCKKTLENKGKKLDPASQAECREFESRPAL